MRQNKWTGASIASNFKHKIFYVLIKLGGRFAAYLLLYFVAAVYTIIPSIRKKTYFYIEKRFNCSNLILKIYHCYRLYLSFGKILVDKAVFGILKKFEIVSSIEDQEFCKNLYDKNKRLIFITAHCGCWQSAMAAFDFIKADKYVLYKRVKEDIDKQVYEHGNIKNNVNFIDPASAYGGAVEMLNALDKNGIICVMGDRTFGSSKSKVKVNFLNKEIELPATIYRIAAISNTPIVIVFFPSKNKGKIDSFIADSFYVKDKGIKLLNYKEDTLRFANALEEFTKKFPYQFFNFYDMWDIENLGEKK